MSDDQRIGSGVTYRRRVGQTMRSISELRAQEAEQEAELVRQIEQIAAEGEWYAVAEVAAGNNRSDLVPPLLYREWSHGRLSMEQLHWALAGAWVDNPRPQDCLGERKWLAMFKAAGWVTASVEAVIEGSAVEPDFTHYDAQPEGPILVWRGAAQDRGRRMSWSAHRECAVGFAESAARLGFNACLYSAIVPARAVLASFGDEREQEYVVNPNMLRGRMSIVERFPAKPLRAIDGPFGSGSEVTHRT